MNGRSGLLQKMFDQCGKREQQRQESK